jgi:hypothetical protein
MADDHSTLIDMAAASLLRAEPSIERTCALFEVFSGVGRVARETGRLRLHAETLDRRDYLWHFFCRANPWSPAAGTVQGETNSPVPGRKPPPHPRQAKTDGDTEGAPPGAW